MQLEYEKAKLRDKANNPDYRGRIRREFVWPESRDLMSTDPRHTSEENTAGDTQT
jgi:hypothetical protein